MSLEIVQKVAKKGRLIYEKIDTQDRVEHEDGLIIFERKTDGDNDCLEEDDFIQVQMVFYDLENKKRIYTTSIELLDFIKMCNKITEPPLKDINDRTSQ